MSYTTLVILALSLPVALSIYGFFLSHSFKYCDKCKRITLHETIDSDFAYEKKHKITICCRYEKHDDYTYTPSNEPLQKGWPLL